MLQLTPYVVLSKQVVDLACADADLGKFGFDEIRAFADQLDVEHSESILEMFESSLRAVAANRNNVKAGTSIMRMITSGEYLSRPPESILLSMVDRLFRPPAA